MIKKHFIAILPVFLLLLSCNIKKDATTDTTDAINPTGPVFNADSAYNFCQAQCDFGPRTMNSPAHEKCGEWIIDKFKQYGMDVTTQQMTLNAYDGTPLKCTNIIASYKPELTTRIMLCAHWDTRPWADNDPDEDNHRKPVIGANDGASGIAVMLEVARLLQHADTTLNIGVDFVCFDAEDMGTPQWADNGESEDTWALGAQYWSKNPHKDGYEARFGILLDMVGGEGAHFYKEGVSKYFAPEIVNKVWDAAKAAGYGSTFPKKDGGMVTDDHLPINHNTAIPTIDIIAYYPDCRRSGFGPTWHTINDDMAHIDKNVLKAVGQTVIQVLFSE